MGYLHFTCHHSADSIDQTLVLQPHPQVTLNRIPMTWFSTQRNVTHVMLGLTMKTIECDRMERVYEVIEEDEHLLHPWAELKALPSFSPYLASARKLEAVRGTRPGLWLVAVEPVRVLPLT